MPSTLQLIEGKRGKRGVFPRKTGHPSQLNETKWLLREALGQIGNHTEMVRVEWGTTIHSQPPLEGTLLMNALP